MFQVGDKVRIKETGLHLDILYKRRSYGYVVDTSALNQGTFKGTIRVRFPCELHYSDNYTAGKNREFWVRTDNLEKIGRKKKEPIPEGWE